MQIDGIEIFSGTPDFAFETIRRLEVKCEASNALMPAPTIEEANGRLRALAAKASANAIINVEYNSGVSFTSWKSLKATGLAVRRISDSRLCPYCAEEIKKAASVCKHCGKDVDIIFPDEKVVSDTNPENLNLEPLRDNNNPAIIIAIIIGVVIFLAMIAQV